MQCHSRSGKSHQVELSVSPITISIVQEINERYCLIDVSMCGMFNKPRKAVQNVKDFKSNDIGTYLTTLK